MPTHDRSSSVKRRGPSERSWTIRTVHFEPTISAAPATEHVGAEWTGSIVRAATTGLYGPARRFSGRLSCRVERCEERARDPASELMLRNARDAVEDPSPPAGVEPCDGREAAVEGADARGVPLRAPAECLVAHVMETGVAQGSRPCPDVEGERRSAVHARARARVDVLEQRARRRDERVRLVRHTEQRPPESDPAAGPQGREQTGEAGVLVDPVERRGRDGEIEGCRRQVGVLERSRDELDSTGGAFAQVRFELAIRLDRDDVGAEREQGCVTWPVPDPTSSTRVPGASPQRSASTSYTRSGCPGRPASYAAGSSPNTLRPSRRSNAGRVTVR